MLVSSFDVQNIRNIRLARWDNLPPITIITGPNGSGKSTLLDAIRRNCGVPVLYLGPHRSSRRQTVRLRNLLQSPIAMSQLLSATSLPGFEGISIPDQQRDPWNFDEAGSFLKHSLCQVEFDRQSALTKRLDQKGFVSKADVGDVWMPLDNLIGNLLPHMSFDKIDVTNRDAVRCLFKVHSNEMLVDIDELSSGEKAVIQLFYPLVEHQVKENISSIEIPKEQKLARTEIAVLIDEPELHLHPIVQGKILDYMRKLSTETKAQFILATHSPTMVEQASNDELFLLRPAELVEQNENQFVQIANTQERLELLREQFGSTSNITALRPILVVESTVANANSKSPSDARVYGFLSDRFGTINVIPGGGKNEVKALAVRLNEFIKSFSPSLTAMSLLDQDTDDVSLKSGEIFLPVSMIENFLIDPEVIWEAVATVKHKTKLTNSQDVSNSLDSILMGITPKEIDRRAKAKFAVDFFRLSDPLSSAAEQLAHFIATIEEKYSSENIRLAESGARERVSYLEKTKQRREHFDGKLVLQKFFRKELHSTGMSKEIFLYECAKQAAKRKSVQVFVTDLFSRIGR